MANTLTDSQQSVVSINPKSKKGNKARIDGVPTWESSNPDIVTVEASADGLTATVKAVGPEGDAQIKMTADADLGEGVKPIIGLGDVTVIAGEAVTVDLNFAPAEEQPEVPPPSP